MKIKEGTKQKDGGCNFCPAHDPHQKVFIITGVGHGPQLEVRFCKKHAEQFKKRVK